MELQHFSHKHPLILGEVNDDGEAIVCNVCWEKISGSAFSCKNCLFFLHKFCAEFPEVMKHPIHAHSLTLRQPRFTTRCDVCNKKICGFTYHCSPCDFDVDIRCSVRGQHFSSKHQLMILNEDEKNDVDERVSCDVCLQQITGPAAYKCTNCSVSIYLHKLCAEQPAEMEHPMHPEHPLALLQVVPNKFRCDGCDICLKEFIYRCSICNFNLDICCALKAQKLKHESHKHPLSLMFSSASFECHACGTERKGMSYMCNTCSFWIHEDCASLTPTFKHHDHIHPLTLIYRKIRERESAIKVENIDEANLIHLPMADDSIGAIDLFLKQISMEDNKREAELNHFSHHHPLILFDAQGDNNLCYENELLILNELNKDKICNACVRKISAPFYSCGLCDFFLHRWCAKLPNELEHPCHPHPLILLKKPPEPRGFFYCEGCRNFCNGFAFRCKKGKCMDNYNYYLDVKCASLPKAVIHKVHEHPLFLKKDCITAGCAACDRCIEMFSFGCDICNFNLHYTCAVLPDTIKHRYDEHHPFTLIYAPIKDGPDEYICEFCEEEIDPKWWFYHCIDCDQSACAKCICAERKKVLNIKWGSTYKL
ncbi:hypothetical protein TEA_019493 [Camellia sinensis var. sinensis]|uniref:Phorbol-ester/DAG-type domain-containing protein n=1 Tax=Camellia sinensis var. sinensis TaxID=542762 RepID=A0A4S4DDW6_CAMSN|nr:hypothetical protein TEA_019493 [Camellia sinensis var. sinensis]